MNKEIIAAIFAIVTSILITLIGLLILIFFNLSFLLVYAIFVFSFVSLSYLFLYLRLQHNIERVGNNNKRSIEALINQKLSDIRLSREG